MFKNNKPERVYKLGEGIELTQSDVDAFVEAIPLPSILIRPTIESNLTEEGFGMLEEMIKSQIIPRISADKFDEHAKYIDKVEFDDVATVLFTGTDPNGNKRITTAIIGYNKNADGTFTFGAPIEAWTEFKLYDKIKADILETFREARKQKIEQDEKK